MATSSRLSSLRRKAHGHGKRERVLGEEQDDCSGSLLPGRLMETAGTVTLEEAKCSWTAVLKTWPCGSNVGLTAEAKTVLLVSLMRKNVGMG